MMNTRRQFLRALSLAIACAPFKSVLAKSATLSTSVDAGASNFRYIYGQNDYKIQFHDFLSNVFHLFPEDDLHQLIAEASKEFPSDEQIYKNLQSEVENIQPFLAA
ncbi:MAG: hypothetical protein KJO81_11295, partial [Gammaproteobacteria bacterium]|nr:hypothetical protein [Gammaproteobacteria bacterium]